MISQNLLQINETNIDQLIEPNQEQPLKKKKEEMKVIDKKQKAERPQLEVKTSSNLKVSMMKRPTKITLESPKKLVE